MKMHDDELQLLADVTLLGILKKEPDESIDDVLLILCETGMYTLKEAKAVLKHLRKNGYVVNGALTVKGMLRAKEAEMKFQ
jgi:hypothetical protein